MQTDKLSKKIDVVLYGREYWDQVLNLRPMVEWGAIAEQDLELSMLRRHAGGRVRAAARAPLAHHLEPPTAQEAAAPGIAKTRG